LFLVTVLGTDVLVVTHQRLATQGSKEGIFFYHKLDESYFTTSKRKIWNFWKFAGCIVPNFMND
jgi:hypothetical protein